MFTKRAARALLKWNPGILKIISANYRKQPSPSTLYTLRQTAHVRMRGKISIPPYRQLLTFFVVFF